MFETYKGRIEFIMVYIREAHPIDGRMPMEFGLIEDPVTDAERHGVAKQCVAGMDLSIPAVVDKIDDAVNHAYAGWPERLFLVDAKGEINYAGGSGPFGFKPDELEAAIKKLVK